jgi:N-acetylglucosamine repressor
VMLATCDLAGRVIDRESFKTLPDAEATLEKILECAGHLIKRGRGVEAVGVSIPGLVEVESGNVIFIPHYRWRDWEVAKRLKQATGLPVTIDNDANAAALAELWFGRPEIREVRDFVMVLVEEGLGTGLVFDGQVYHGEAGAAGEFGHMTIGAGAPVACAAGKYECWESFASERAAVARYANLTRRDGGGAPCLTFSRIVDSALGGEEEARIALVETGRYLGVGISNIIKGLSPEAVIVGGEISRAWPIISKELIGAVEEYSLCRGMKSARIIPSTLGETPRLMGALSLVLSSKFAAVTTA